MTIGLKEAIKLVREADPSNLESLLSDPRLIQFFDEVNKMNKQDAISAVEFVEISTVLQLLTHYQHSPSDIMTVMVMSADEIFENAIKLAFKSGIGISILEEIR